MITVAYWVLIHDVLVRDDPRMQEPLYFFELCNLHVWPIFAIAVNVLLTRVEFTYSHCWYFMKYSLPYMLINYIGTIDRGKPIYHFMPWTDYMTVVIGLALFFVGMLMFLVCCFAVNSLKGVSQTKKID